MYMLLTADGVTVERHRITKTAYHALRVEARRNVAKQDYTEPVDVPMRDGGTCGVPSLRIYDRKPITLGKDGRSTTVDLRP